MGIFDRISQAFAGKPEGKGTPTPTTNIMVDLDKYFSDGYLLMKNVFSKDEIASWRKQLDASPPLGGDLLNDPRFYHIVYDNRILEVAALILGKKPTYFEFSSMNRAKNDGPFTGWHRDNADRLDPTGPDWGPPNPYSCIRFGIYLQDHKRTSGGLMLRPKTHRAEHFNDKEGVYLDNEPGDLAVWDMRIVHAGLGVRRKKEPNRVVEVAEMKTIDPAELMPPHDGWRYAAFISYGADDQHTQNYIDYLTTREFMVGAWKRCNPCPEALRDLPRDRLNYRHIWDEIKDKPGIGANKGHVEKAHLAGAAKGAEIEASH